MMLQIFSILMCLQLVFGSNELNNNKMSEFTTDLFDNIINDEHYQNNNIILSPFSIQTCLAMAFFGAEGKTADELVNVLHLGSSNKKLIAENYEKLLDSTKTTSMLKIANKIFVNQNYDIKLEYNEIAKKTFHSDIDKLDFNNNIDSIKLINNWVENQTNNKIKDLLKSDDIDNDTKMFIINAIYFKGRWTQTFPRTTKNKFWLNNDNNVDVNMMHKNGFFHYGEFNELLNSNIIQMSYEHSEFSMLIILPNERDGLIELEKKLKTINLIELTNNLTMEYVSLNLPKFRADFTISLEGILRKMGINEIFSDSADLSSIFQSASGGHVSKIMHKAFINVDENGSEAAAATYLKAVRTSAIIGPEPKIFKADHPFVFLIKDRESIYFIGHIRKF